VLLLLHGALGAADQMAPLVPLLESGFAPRLLDLPGHGPAPLTGGFDTGSFAGFLIDWLEREQLGPVDCFGYSMGGYVALETARQRPDLIRNVATLGTKFDWSVENAARETRLLDPAAIRAKVPYFAELLQSRHTALGWETVLRHTAELMMVLGREPLLTHERLSQVTRRVRIMVGDRDGTVSVAESHAAAKAIPEGELEVLPRTPHPFERVSLQRVGWSLREFFLGRTDGRTD
jgi:pimeloyl-ACP methyl ester carboxylesterase